MKLSTQARFAGWFAYLLMLVELCGGIQMEQNAS
jgi:hypothetical protein